MANQDQVLTIVREWTAEHGTAPTYAEIGRLAGIHRSTVHGHVVRLQKAGLLEKRERSWRSARLLTDPEKELRRARSEAMRFEDEAFTLKAELAKADDLKRAAVREAVRQAVAVMASSLLSGEICAVVLAASRAAEWTETERNMTARRCGIIDIEGETIRLTEFGRMLSEEMGFVDPGGDRQEPDADALRRENDRLRSLIGSLYKRIGRS